MNKEKNSINKERVFSFVQRLSQSIMLPITLMPIAGFLLAIGATFTQEIIIGQLGLSSLIHEGTILFQILTLMKVIGQTVIDNLALFFAISIAIGFSNKKKEIGALSAIISFLIMHETLNYLLIFGKVINSTGELLPGAKEGMIATILGIPTLQVGVFGGIIVGFVVALLNNKFNEIELPSMFSFFEGSNFIPIVSIFASMILGGIFYIIWPGIQSGIVFLASYISNLGIIGAFLFSTIKRLLIPFGLHHVFYLPFWQTSLGGTQVINGVTYVGAQNIYFAQLADSSIHHISPSVTQYFGGEFAPMIFGLPAGAYAIYRHTAKKFKKSTKSAMQSAALTSALVGITEPIEFQIIPVVPILFIFHAIMCGLCNALQVALNFAVGCTFSSGLLDLIFLGILPGNDRTGWIVIIPIGIAIAIIYYLAFTITITKFNVKFPTQIDNSESISISKDDRSKLIVEGLGGIDNIEDQNCCATRLRCTVKNPDLINEDILNKTKVIYIQRKGTGVQLVYGTKANIIQAKLDQYIKGINTLEESSLSKNTIDIESPLSGEVIPLNEVPDDTFASGVMGEGIAIKPNNNEVKAPTDGTITFIAPTKHAFAFECDNGISILVHLGIDTVSLDGKGFKLLTNEGEHVSKGTTILEMDIDFIKNQGLSTISPIVCTELKDNEKITNITESTSIKYENELFRIEKK